MTRRSELAHRMAEVRARVLTHLANRAFSFRTTGLDGLAKRLLAGASRRPARPAQPQPEQP